MKEGRKPEYPEKTLATSSRKCHILQPEDSSPKQDSNSRSSSCGRLGKQTCSLLHHASPHMSTYTVEQTCTQRHTSMYKCHHHHHHHHGGPSVSRMTISVPLICGYRSGSAGQSWTCRAVRSLGTGSSHLSLGYRLPSGGVLWRTVLDGDALPLAQMTQIVKVCASAVCPEQ